MSLLKADEGVSKISDSDALTYDEVSDWNDAITRAGEFLKKYFKVIKDCGTDSANICFADEYYSIDKTAGPSDPNSWMSYYRIITASGVSMAIIPALYNTPGTVIIDINGTKKPNIAGRDLFSFSFYYDGSLDESATPECKKGLQNKNGVLCGGQSDAKVLREIRFQDRCTSQASGGPYGNGCLGKILNDNWKMDY